MGERSIFITALDKACPKERAAYVEEACGLDRALRQRVEQLLEIHRDGDGFLETPAVAEVFPDAFQVDRPAVVNGSPHPGAGTVAAGGPPPDDAGTRIGAYKLLQKIGEGGMGVVYMADQERPVRRRVALKVIKPGMDSAQVIARFEAERQALAMMDHPHIARVFDAGTTDGGRPYFVMELVQGVPVTKYCDENQLTLRERLALFVDVCHAIQHAHQKGVIHRDVKPTNVLVTLCDGRPVPKVIDFGIAKAVEQRLTERTLFTHFGMMVGTLEYMSPEQAEMSSVGVDTRGDVFSLGVLLYELLTGSTPLQRERLREAAFAEVLRRIREEEPPRPSTRLVTSGEMLATISGRRRTEPQKLTRLVRGELDWIVMRCLEKDRTRRYETVNGLARDVERYLADEPVSAGPPGAGYRLGKFARRNKALLATASAVAAALLLGTALATYGLVAARRDRADALEARAAEAQERKSAVEAKELAERQRAAANDEAVKSAAVSRFLRDMFASAAPGGPGGVNTTVREALDKAVRELDGGKLAAHGGVEAAVRQTIGSAYVSLRHLAAAEAQLNTALALQKQLLDPAHADVAATLHAIGNLHQARGWWGTAADHYRGALAIRRKTFGEEHELVAASLSMLADSVARDAIVRKVGLDEAEALTNQADALVRKLGGERSVRAADTLANRGLVLGGRGDHAGAEALWRQALAIYQDLLGEKHHTVAYTKFRLTIPLRAQGDDAGAERLLREAIAGYRDYYGPDHPKLAVPLDHLRQVLERRSDPEAVTVGMEWQRVELARLNTELKTLPNDPGLLTERAIRYSHLGRVREALEDHERLLTLDPDNCESRFWAAVARLYLGDLEGYREYARDLMTRFADRGDAGVKDRVAKTFLLNPPPASESDFEAAGRMADEALALPHEPNVTPFLEMTRGFCEYRLGRFEACLEWVVRARNHPAVWGDRRKLDGACLALAAMAQHRLGFAEQASRSLAECQRLLDQSPKPGEADPGTGPVNRLVWEIMLREARDLVAPGPDGQVAAVSPPSSAVSGGAARQGGAAAQSQIGLLEREAVRLSAELRARPDDPDLAAARAVVHARVGRFAEALADREVLIRGRPDDFNAYFCAAVSRLYDGDVARYRAYVKRMMERAATSPHGAEWERAATAYLLSPPPGGDLAAATQLVDRDLAGARGEGWLGWAELTKAMAEYRADRFAACLEWLEKFRAVAPDMVYGDPRYLEGTGSALAAMAYHRLGRPQDARRSLDEATRLMEKCPRPGEADLGDTPERWQAWEILMREARGLLGTAATGG